MARATISVRDNAETCLARAKQDLAFPPAPTASVAEARARQSAKLRELGIALAKAGLVTLDEQARALSLCRSTTWTILRGSHKGSGLSATTVDRMLGAPELPASVRTRIFEYAAEKASGLYGHKKAQRRRFYARIAHPSRDEQQPIASDTEYDHVF